MFNEGTIHSSKGLSQWIVVTWTRLVDDDVDIKDLIFSVFFDQMGSKACCEYVPRLLTQE